MTHKSDIDIRQSVVPVLCGNKKGTSFFISETQLLTVRHVVSEFSDNVDIEIFYNGEFIKCDKYDLEGIDVALLTIRKTQNISVTPLKLIATGKGAADELRVIGYPQELGNNKEKFEVKARIIESVDIANGYDTILERSEPIAFKSYKGFSGSPVLNSHNSVIGIITTQLTTDFCFISIRACKDSLKSLYVAVDDNWEYEDNSTYYGGHCRQIRKKTFDGIKGRINDTDVPNQRVMKLCRDFCNHRILPDYKDRSLYLINYINSHNLLPVLFSREELTNFLLDEDSILKVYEKILGNKKKLREAGISEGESYRLIEDFKIFRDLRSSIEAAGKKFFCLYGIAGTGKTHTMAYLSEEIEMQENVYFLLGTEFNVSRSHEEDLNRLVGFSVDDFPELDRIMAEQGHDAIFIIDAVNEGPGILYWNENLPKLVSAIEGCNHLKLLITVRCPYEKKLMENLDSTEWLKHEIKGFEDVSRAVKTLFGDKGIDSEYKDQFKEELSNPLFLNIFKTALPLLSKKVPDKDIHPILYEKYIEIKNGKVSEICDEDSHRNVAFKYLKKLAHYSLFYRYCLDIPRSKARQYADRICWHRTWPNNLLKAVLDESLLLDTLSEDLEDEVMFQFENMGDVLKAQELCSSKMSDEQCVEFLRDQYRLIGRKEISESKFVYMVAALLGIWNRDLNLITLPEFSASGIFSKSVLEAKRYSKGPYHEEIMKRTLQSRTHWSPADLLGSIFSYSLVEYEKQHKYLLQLSFNELNSQWAIRVNELFERTSYDYGRWDISQFDDEDVFRKFLLTITWMLSSSHPEARARLMRKIYSMLSSRPEQALYLMDMFESCQDPYVLQGIYAAIYGVTCNREVSMEEVDKIADNVYNRYYAQRNNAPADLIIRQFTLSILERAEVRGASKHWSELCEKTKLRFESSNPFNDMDDASALSDNDTFGASRQSKKIYNSLYSYDGDFNRYVIGTNNDSVSRDFFEEKEHRQCEGISLKKIIRMVGGFIKKDLGWNDAVAIATEGQGSKNRHDNSTERMGKKYQWIALYNIAGRLCDHCLMVNGEYSAQKLLEDMEDVHYPWLSRWCSKFDATLPDRIEKLYDDVVKPYVEFERIVEPCVDFSPAEEWLNDRHKLPNVQYVMHDVNGEEWSIIDLITTSEFHHSGKVKRYTTFTNSVLIPVDSADKFEEKFKARDIYGRWMPESNDNTDFRWAEYPSCSSYKLCETHRLGDEQNDTFGIPSKKTFITQLQEDSRGLNETEEYLPSAEMLCEDMMQQLNLYDAERGIIRDRETEEIMAINLKPFDKNIVSGLAIKRSKLNQYLSTTKQVMFYGTFGEKTVYEEKEFAHSKMEFFTGSCRYDAEGEMTVLVPLQYGKDFNEK